jgi:Fe-S cluster assembly protein SufD
MTAATLHQPFLDALGPSPVDALSVVRQQARARFADSGFPTRRNETWKFTELRPLVETRFALSGATDVGAFEAPGDADLLVFVNGRFSAAQSRIGALPDGVVLSSFADWARREPQAAAASFDLGGGAERAFLSLNAAFVGDGAVLIVPDGVALERRVRIVHWSQAEAASASHVKQIIRLGAGAAATVIESFAGTGGYWTNFSATVELGARARLGHYTLQDESSDAFHTAHLAATIGAGGHYDSFLLTLGARMARQDLQANLVGPDITCGYSGAYLLGGRQEAAVNALIRHAAPGGRTREVFKGCVGDRAHGVFQGKILVEQAAQKTDAHQLNKTMLLGDRAVMDSKPELEIYADDVKCSHGATVGDLDETALFYLRSRGIAPDAARRMLIEAFVLEAVDLVEDEVARNFLAQAIERRLQASENRT